MATRRQFLSALGIAVAAPAIVHAANLMPVRSVRPAGLLIHTPEGAWLQSVVHDGKIVAITVLQAGRGYSDADTVTFLSGSREVWDVYVEKC